MTSVLLVDSRRSFLDGRDCFTARTNVNALKYLHANEFKIREIWFDSDIGGKGGLKPVLDYLVMRAKMGAPYKVNIIYVHCQDEAGWQVLQAKLKNAKYNVQRATVRNTLGAY